MNERMTDSVVFQAKNVCVKVEGIRPPPPPQAFIRDFVFKNN